MKKLALKVVLVLGVISLALLVLNYQWLGANLGFWLHNGQVSSSIAPSQGAKANPNVLEIPSLGIITPVVYVDQNSEKIFQQALKNGVVHYPGTAMPGQPGNVYIFGHSSDYIWSGGNYKTAFALLPRIEKGAEIQLSDSQGRLYTYRVIETVVVPPDAVQYLDQGNYQKKMLTVQTSYPVGTALRRFLAIAELQP